MAIFGTWMQPGTWNSLAALSAVFPTDFAGKVSRNFVYLLLKGTVSRDGSQKNLGIVVWPNLK
jgi:hypothetical protein